MNPLRVFITGAAKGIGFETARLLGERNAAVFLGARDPHRGDAAAAKLRAAGHSVQYVPVDVTSEASLQQAAAHIQEHAGRLDVLINNAAILLDSEGDVLGLNASTLHRTLDTNLLGVLRATQAFLSSLRQSPAPRIINVSSGAGQLDGEPQLWAPAYSISKTGLNMLTQQFAGALRGYAVNAVCPGWCRTDMGGQEAPHSAADGADTLVWLATEAPQTLTGQFLRARKPIPW